jgi:serine/threonine protein kinase
LVGARYQLDELIGRGAMGEVWRAKDQVTQTLVALKLVAIDREQGGLDRLTNEARSASAINNPHVVKILDHGYHEGIAFIAMELLRGETLASRLRRMTKLGPVETVSVVRQVALGLAVAHRLNIVHRDLKPENVFLANTELGEEVKILDFGIAKSFGSQANQTQQGVVVGTPAYLSHEQIMGTHPVDARTDFWALAIVTFECLTGHLPYEASTVAELFVQIVGPARENALVKSALPPAFKTWFRRATDPDPDERFESGREFVEELRRALLPNAAVSEWELESSVQLNARPTRRRLALLVGALLVLATSLSVWAVLAFIGKAGPSNSGRDGATAEPSVAVSAQLPVTSETPDAAPSVALPAADPSAAAVPVPSAVSTDSAAASDPAIPAEPPAASASVSVAAPSSVPSVSAVVPSSKPQVKRPRDRWGLGI